MQNDVFIDVNDVVNSSVSWLLNFIWRAQTRRLIASINEDKRKWLFINVVSKMKIVSLSWKKKYILNLQL